QGHRRRRVGTRGVVYWPYWYTRLRSRGALEPVMAWTTRGSATTSVFCRVDASLSRAEDMRLLKEVRESPPLTGTSGLSSHTVTSEASMSFHKDTGRPWCLPTLNLLNEDHSS